LRSPSFFFENIITESDIERLLAEMHYENIPQKFLYEQKEVIKIWGVSLGTPQSQGATP